MWTCVSRQALVVVEEPKFHEMISHLSKDMVEMLPKSGNTVRKWILDEFKYQRNILIEVFHQARS